MASFTIAVSGGARSAHAAMGTACVSRSIVRARGVAPSAGSRLFRKPRGVQVAVATRRAVRLAAATPSRPVVIIDNYDSFTYNLSQVRTRGLF